MRPLWKIVWRFPKKLKIELACDPAVPLLGVCPKEIKSGLHSPVHCGSIHNCQQMETIQVSVDEGVSLMLDHCLKAILLCVKYYYPARSQGWFLKIFRPHVTYKINLSKYSQEAPSERKRGAVERKPSTNFPLMHGAWLEARIPRSPRDLLKGDKGRERERQSHAWRSQIVWEASRPKESQLEKLPQPPFTPLSTLGPRMSCDESSGYTV